MGSRKGEGGMLRPSLARNTWRNVAAIIRGGVNSLWLDASFSTFRRSHPLRRAAVPYGTMGKPRRSYPRPVTCTAWRRAGLASWSEQIRYFGVLNQWFGLLSLRFSSCFLLNW